MVIQRFLRPRLIYAKVRRIQCIVRGFLGRRRYRKIKNAMFWAEEARWVVLLGPSRKGTDGVTPF